MSVRIGKCHIVRLTGKDYKKLQVDCFERDRGGCRECGVPTLFGAPQEYSNAFHMAHTRTKRNNGDTLDNVRTLCGDCHRLEHAGGKPVPKKA